MLSLFEFLGSSPLFTLVSRLVFPLTIFSLTSLTIVAAYAMSKSQMASEPTLNKADLAVKTSQKTL